MADIPYWIESLVFSFRSSITARLSPDRTLYFHFLEQAPATWTDNSSGFTPFNDNQRAFIRDVFAYFSTIIDVKFVETNTYSSFNTIVLGNNDQGGSGSAGYMTGAPGDEAWGLFISNVHPNAASLLNPQSSAWVPQTYVHELGHVLGLKHPFGNTLPILSDAEDNFDLTIMTYGSKSPGISAPTSILLQPLDIAALQYLYGPSKTAANATRDDSYTLDPNGRNFIWDGGGTDKLDASASTQRVVLDLEPLSQGYFGALPASLISASGQITINAGSVIEQVSATSLDDILFGNAADNVFWTNGGIDYVNGRSGSDTVVVNSAYSASQLYLEGTDLVIAYGSGQIVRLAEVETVRYSDGERSVASLMQLAQIAPYASIGNKPAATITKAVALNYEFSETVTGLTASDFVVTNGQILSVTGSGKSYVVTVVPAEQAAGILSVQLRAGAVTGASGASNLASQAQYLSFDTQAVSLLPQSDSAAATNGTISLKFDDSFTLGAGDIIVQSSSGAELARLSKDDTARVYQKGSVLYLDLEPQVAEGATLTVIIPAGVILDPNGNTIGYSITTTANRVAETVGTSGADTKNLGPLADIFMGLAGDDRIWGEEGADLIDGGEGNDRLNGMQGNDFLYGREGDDTLIGGTGDDVMDGGDGTDIVQYGFASSLATITRTTEGYTISSAAEGTDKLTTVERIQFSDKVVMLEAGPDNTPPSLVSSSGGSLFPLTANIDLKFSEAVQKGSGTIELRLGSSTGQLVEAFDIATSARLTISGSTVSIDPTGELLLNERYVLILPSGAFQDWTGNQSALIDAYDFVAVRGPNVAPAFRFNGLLTNPPLGGSGERTQEDTPLTLNTTKFAVDADGDALAFSSSTPSNGTISVSGSLVTYTPRKDFYGEDNFTLTVSDGKGGTASIPVTITVASLNDAPTFSSSSQAVSATSGTAKTITLAATDEDGDALTYTVATPSKGSATISGSTLTYTPTSSASGADSFVVTARDPSGATATQTINVTVSAVSSTDFRLTASDGWTGAIGGNGLVYGNSGYQDIKVLSGTVTFDASFNKGGDIVRFDAAASSYTVARAGSSAQINAGTDLCAVIPIGTIGTVTSFSDGVRKLAFDNSNFALGAQTFSTSATTISAAADGTSLPTGASSSASARISLAGNDLRSGQTSHITIGGKAIIYGNAAKADVVAIASGVNVDLTFDASFNRGADTIILDKSAGSYSAIRSGTSIILTSTSQTLTIPVGTSNTTIRFADDSRALVYSTSEAAIKLGTQTIATTATAISSSSVTTSLDVGTSSSTTTVSGANGKVIFTDDATKSSYVKITNFGSDDIIRVTGATEGQYSFTNADLDGDGQADDLSITFSNPDAGIVNDIQIINAVSPTAFVGDMSTAISAVGFNFISFG